MDAGETERSLVHAAFQSIHRPSPLSHFQQSVHPSLSNLPGTLAGLKHCFDGFLLRLADM